MSNGGRRTGSSSKRRGSRDKQRVSVEDLITKELPERASKASERLREHLEGVIGIDLVDHSGYQLKWADSALEVEEVESIGDVDCCIRIAGDDLLEISSGKLNPQVAMLSDKIHVTGQPGFAVYFFNLFTIR